MSFLNRIIFTLFLYDLQPTQKILKARESDLYGVNQITQHKIDSY